MSCRIFRSLRTIIGVGAERDNLNRSVFIKVSALVAPVWATRSESETFRYRAGREEFASEQVPPAAVSSFAIRSGGMYVKIRS